MYSASSNITFAEWIRLIFDHPPGDPAWYWREDAEEISLPPAQLVEYVTGLFLNAGELLSPYSDEQVDASLWYLISSATSGLYALGDESIPLDDRVKCVRSMTSLYEQCFVPRCSPALGYLDEEGAALNSICYMWWDVLPWAAHEDEVRFQAIDQACLRVMEETLNLPSIACQESALHGLSHWLYHYPEQIDPIFEKFLRRRDLSPNLRRYAINASEGTVQ